MIKTDPNIDEEIAKAIEAYRGNVTVLPAGSARAPRRIETGRTETGQWLKEHRRDKPEIAERAKRRAMRIVRQNRERIASNNAPLLKRIERQEQIEASFKALREIAAKRHGSA